MDRRHFSNGPCANLELYVPATGTLLGQDVNSL
jgi:hypothetical protein